MASRCDQNRGRSVDFSPLFVPYRITEAAEYADVRQRTLNHMDSYMTPGHALITCGSPGPDLSTAVHGLQFSEHPCGYLEWITSFAFYVVRIRHRDRGVKRT